MVVEALRFAGKGGDGTPARVQVDADRFEALLASEPGPAVFILRAPDLHGLLAAEPVKQRVGSLRVQHPGKGLATYFAGERPVALEGKYAEVGRLRSSVWRFLEHARRAGDRGVHFLGVSP